MKMQIERVGEFVVRQPIVIKNKNQCGARGTTIFRYKVEITGDSRFLTRQGFLIDNNEIHQYFEHKYTLIGVEEFPSCEQIAESACADILKHFSTEKRLKPCLKGLSRICVSISGSQHASLTATWEKPARRTWF